MITYKQINWRRNTQIIRDRIYELEHLAKSPDAIRWISFSSCRHLSAAPPSLWPVPDYALIFWQTFHRQQGHLLQAQAAG